MSGDPAGLAAMVNDAVFDTWGVDAVYKHVDTGVTLPCVILKDDSDRTLNVRGASGVSSPQMQGHWWKVRASEVAAPVKNATLTLTKTGQVLKIISAPKSVDPERTVFEFTASPL